MAGGDPQLLGLELGTETPGRRSARAPPAAPSSSTRWRARVRSGAPAPAPVARAAFSASASTRCSIPSPVLAETLRPSSQREPGRKVDLVQDRDRRGTAHRRARIGAAQAPGGESHCGAVASTTHRTRSASPARAKRPPDPLGLDLAFGLAQARRVDEHDRNAAEIEMHLDHIARGARLPPTRSPRRAWRAHSRRLDLPALGAPAMTTLNPSRNRSPLSVRQMARDRRAHSDATTAIGLCG